jgi:hypothetical protein
MSDKTADVKAKYEADPDVYADVYGDFDPDFDPDVYGDFDRWEDSVAAVKAKLGSKYPLHFDYELDDNFLRYNTFMTTDITFDGESCVHWGPDKIKHYRWDICTLLMWMSVDESDLMNPEYMKMITDDRYIRYASCDSFGDELSVDDNRDPDDRLTGNHWTEEVCIFMQMIVDNFIVTKLIVQTHLVEDEDGIDCPVWAVAPTEP